MEGNIELLNFIHQNAEMGKDTIGQLLGIVEDGPFKEKLGYQYKEYNEIFDIARDRIQQGKESSKGIGELAKLRSYIMINLSTLMNKTPSHIAEMMIQGSTMGIIDITKKLKEYGDADIDIQLLGERLLKFEQQSVEEMKGFL